jgi:hypothetical protein
MNAKALTAVLLKCWGIVLIVSNLVWLVSHFAVSSTSIAEPPPDYLRDVLLSTVVSTSLMAIAGGLAITFANPLAARLFSPAVDGQLSVDAQSLVRVFLVAFGLYLVVEGLQNAAIVGLELSLWRSRSPASLIDIAWGTHRDKLASAVVQLLSGAALLLFRKNVSAALPLEDRSASTYPSEIA